MTLMFKLTNDCKNINKTYNSSNQKAEKLTHLIKTDFNFFYSKMLNYI